MYNLKMKDIVVTSLFPKSFHFTKKQSHRSRDTGLTANARRSDRKNPRILQPNLSPCDALSFGKRARDTSWVCLEAVVKPAQQPN